MGNSSDSVVCTRISSSQTPFERLLIKGTRFGIHRSLTEVCSIMPIDSTHEGISTLADYEIDSTLSGNMRSEERDHDVRAAVG